MRSPAIRAANSSADDVLAPIVAELEACEAANCRIHWWWRDDDAVSDSPQLRRLMVTRDKLQLPVLLSVIPKLCEPSLVDAMRHSPHFAIAQHGFAHVNYETHGRSKSEFGFARPLLNVCSEITAGRDRLRALFGDGYLPIFVPPWNDLRPDMWAQLPELAFRGLSCYGRRMSSEAAPGVMLANTHIEILNWGARPVQLITPTEITDKIVMELRCRRKGHSQGNEPIGILTHHRVMNGGAWDFMERLLSVIKASAKCVAPAEVFGLV
jgi:hypothetical protein